MSAKALFRLDQHRREATPPPLLLDDKPPFCAVRFAVANFEVDVVGSLRQQGEALLTPSYPRCGGFLGCNNLAPFAYDRANTSEHTVRRLGGDAIRVFLGDETDAMESEVAGEKCRFLKQDLFQQIGPRHLLLYRTAPPYVT